jgi:hypothetical protein
MSVPEQRFAFQGAVSPGGTFPAIAGVPLDEPSPGDAGTLASVDWTIVTKSLDEPVTSSSTIQDDDQLKFKVAAGVLYEFDLSLVYMCSSATPDIKTDWGVDAGAVTGQVTGIGPDVVNTFGVQGSNDFATPIVFGTTGANTPRLARVLGVCLPDTSTTFKFQWAQNTSNIASTIVKAGSRLRYRRLR